LQPDDNDAHPSAVENVDGSGNRAVVVFVQHWILKFCNFYLFIFYSAFFQHSYSAFSLIFCNIWPNLISFGLFQNLKCYVHFPLLHPAHHPVWLEK
jgi:hypothetical protein